MKDKKILIVGRMFSGDRAISGPASVLKALVQEFSARSVNFEFLEYNTDKVSKVKYILDLIKKTLFKSNLIVNVHTEGLLIPFIVYMISILNRRNEYYLTVHGIYIMDSKYAGRKIKFLKKLQERILIRNFSNIICVSEMLKRDVENIFNRAKNVFVANNGIYIKDIEFKASKPDEKHINLIAAGGVKRIKGIFEALEAVKYINGKSEDLKVYLNVFGSYDSEETLKEFEGLIKSYSLGQHVTYKGVIQDKEELYRKYSAADLNLCNSHYDTFNSSIIESMACGTPSAASKNCGAAYLLDPFIDGFVVDIDGDFKEQLYDIIVNYVSDKDKFNVMRKKAYEKAREYSWKRSAQDYLDIFYKGEHTL
jgi:glycosyltransferase involved in cell wall biosynthesis